MSKMVANTDNANCAEDEPYNDFYPNSGNDANTENVPDVGR